MNAGGGGVHADKSKSTTSKKVIAPPPEPEFELIPESKIVVEPKVYFLHFSNPRWSVKEGHFLDTVEAMVDVEVPESHRRNNEVEFKIEIVLPNDRREKIGTKYANTKKGVATVEVYFDHHNISEGKRADRCQFVFTARHPDAKEIKSQEITVTNATVTFIFELEDALNFTKSGDTLVLKAVNGESQLKRSSADALKKNGKTTFEFKDLDPEKEYDLELQNSHGEKLENIFSKKGWRDWKKQMPMKK